MQFRNHPGRRFRLAERQLRMPVQPASQCHGMLSPGIDVNQQFFSQFSHLSFPADTLQTSRQRSPCLYEHVPSPSYLVYL